MSEIQAENLVKSIIRDVVQECAARGLSVSDSLASVTVKDVVLDPINGFNEDRPLTKRDIQKLEELCLDKLLKNCSPSPHTLKMQPDVGKNSTSRSALQGAEPPMMQATTQDVGTQMDLHPVESYIDKSYEWNEWELRRKALQLADLRTKATHSTQTDESHMRRENVTQTWLPKEAGCQTKRDGETSMPRPQVYLAGLRGQRDAPAAKVDLTRPQ